MGIFFTIILIINSLLSFLALGIAIILLRRAKNDKIYLNFGIANLFLSFWILTVVFRYSEFFNLPLIFNMQLSYATAIWLAHFFFLFTYYFPLRKMYVKEKNLLIITYLATIIISLMIFTTPFVRGVSLIFPLMYIEMNKALLTVFVLYFIVLSIGGLINLYSSYKKSYGIQKSISKKVFISTAIIIFTNFIFSLTIFYYSTLDLTPIGVIFTFLFIIYVYLILFKD